MKPDNTKEDWIDEVRRLAIRLGAVGRAREATRRKEGELFSKLNWAQIIGERPAEYMEISKELDRLADQSMQLEAQIVNTIMEGCDEEEQP